MENPTRVWLLNRIVLSRGYQSFLEIDMKGCQFLPENLAPVKVGCGAKVRWHGDDERIHPILSDEFFATVPGTFDLVFIDGDHDRGQVKRDLYNALSRLNAGGVVVVHDVDPPDWFHQVCPRRPDAVCWTGQNWRPWVELRAARPNESYTVDADYGLGIVDSLNTRGPVGRAPDGGIDPMCDDVTYDDFSVNRADWLGLVSLAEFMDRFPIR